MKFQNIYFNFLFIVALVSLSTNAMVFSKIPISVIDSTVDFDVEIPEYTLLDKFIQRLQNNAEQVMRNDFVEFMNELQKRKIINKNAVQDLEIDMEFELEFDL